MKIVFEEEVIKQEKTFSTNSIFKAFVYLYNQTQEVDIEAIASISSYTKDDVLTQLDPYIVQNPYWFDLNPNLYQYFMTKEEYLTGNLYDKYLEAVKLNIKYGGYFQKNVDLLKPYIKDISYKDVSDATSLFEDEILDSAGVGPNARVKSILRNAYISYDTIHLIDKRIDSMKDVLHGAAKLFQESDSFFHKMGFTYIHYDKDSLYQLLMNKYSIIMEMDDERRLYEMLFGAMNLIQFHLVDDVTLVSSQVACAQLRRMKNNLCPELNINIQTSRIDLSNCSCVFIEDSAEIHAKVKKAIPKDARIAFFVSCLDRETFYDVYDTLFYDFNRDDLLVGDRIDGFKKTNTLTQCRSYRYECFHNRFGILQKLSNTLCIHQCEPNIVVQQIPSSITDTIEDTQLCYDYDTLHKMTLHQLMKARNQLALDAKMKDALEWIVIFNHVKYKKQLIYIDNDQALEEARKQLIDLMIPEHEIQIVKPNTKINSNASIYLTRTKKVYPYQIQHLDAIHHIDVPSSLPTFYQRSGNVTQYMYVTDGLVDSYYAQNLFYEQRFFDDFKSNEHMRHLFALLFEKSTNNKDIHRTIQANKDFYQYEVENIIEVPSIEEDLPPFENEYIKLKKKKQMSRAIDQLFNETYFNRKERYLYDVGNYKVYLPANFISGYEHLVLKAPNEQSTFIKIHKGENHIQKIINMLSERKLNNE